MKKLLTPQNENSDMKSIDDVKNTMKVQGSHRTLFYRQPSKKHTSSYTTILFYLETDKGNPKKVTFGSEPNAKIMEEISKKEMVITLPVKSEKKVGKGIQTDFRESEAQTLPWRHEIRAEKKVLEDFSVLDSLYSGEERHFLLGMEEVTQFEKAKQKLAWENVVARLRGKENELKRKYLATKIAEAEARNREKARDKINEERMDMSKKLMKKERENWEDKLRSRLVALYERRRKENNKKIYNWNRQLMRKLRKINNERRRSATPSKLDASSIYLNKISNAVRATQIEDIQSVYLKKLNGLLMLEKRLSTASVSKASTFNYEEASKPKKSEFCLRDHRHVDSKNVEVKDNEKTGKSLLVRISVAAPTPELETSKTDRQMSENEEENNKSSILLV